MSAQQLADPIGLAREHLAQRALAESPAPRAGSPGLVGLELELHLVDRHDPLRRPSWARITAALDALPPMPAGSAVTVEPGGQVELSTPPRPGPVAAVRALRADEQALRSALRTHGLGAVALGADPARPVARVNPADRYAAMEQHFAALGCGAPARAMMSSTAALQVNLDAGPRAGWADRLRLLALLVPVLVAVSATSPWLAGRPTPWQSTRRRSWLALDPWRVGPFGAGPADPAEAWAAYALAAPVMLDPDELRPVTRRTPLAAWLSGAATDPALQRRPTAADLDYHLTTLFPPVRPRGYLELRCLDALPLRWWPALVALTVTLADDPVAADRAREACEPLDGREREAARLGLADPAVARAATRCVDAALAACPRELVADLTVLADLLAHGGSPGTEVRARIDAVGPVRVLEEESDG